MTPPRPSTEDDVHLNTYFFHTLLTGDQHQEGATLVEWARNDSVVEVLQRWKEQQLDNVYQYGKLVQVVGFKLDREKWLRNVDQVVRRMMKPPIQLEPGNCTLVDYQMLKVVTQFVASWGAVAREIVQATPVPGDGGSELPANATTFTLKMAYSLLLTALMDLQDNSDGFFQRLLGGPSVQRPSAEGEIRIAKERLPSKTQSRVQRVKSKATDLERNTSTPPPGTKRRAASASSEAETLVPMKRRKVKQVRFSTSPQREQSAALADKTGENDVQNTSAVCGAGSAATEGSDNAIVKRGKVSTDTALAEGAETQAKFDVPERKVADEPQSDASDEEDK